MTKVKRLIVLPIAVVVAVGTGMFVNATGCSSSDGTAAPIDEDGGVDASVAGSGGSKPGSGGSSGRGGNIDYDAQGPTDGSAPDTTLPDGDPPSDTGATHTMTCEVLVVGGGLGAVAAAHEAASWGRHTCMVAPDSWLGGQLTSQATPPDEWFYTLSKTYASLRDRIRQHYLTKYKVKEAAKTATKEDGKGVFNPGACWVSSLCHEPTVAHTQIKEMLAPLETSGKLEIIRFQRPTGIVKSGNVVKGVKFTPTISSGNELIVNAKQTIDATELGDVLPLAGAAYRVGAESKAELGEPDAPEVADPNCVQPITYVFVLERRPDGEEHKIPEPPNYDINNYAIRGRLEGTFYESADGAPFWSFRRLLAADNFEPGSGVPYDVAVINWMDGGNDFDKNCGPPTGCNLLDKTYEEQQAVLQRAKDHALGFLYWIQNEAPRDNNTGKGHPNLMLRMDVFDTADGLSREPYIREARRLKAVTTIREQDAMQSPDPQRKGPRSVRHYDDTIGIARYESFDLHQCADGPIYDFKHPSGNAEIPLGALIPETIDGLLAGAKNIGTTKITNGIYRLHPGEWHVGQAAAAAASMAIETGMTVRALHSDKRLLRTLQYKLITGRGAPIFWWSDLKRDDASRWIAAQMLAAAGVMHGGDELEFYPERIVKRYEGAALIQREFEIPLESCTTPTFTDVPCSHPFAREVEALAKRGITTGVGGGRFDPNSDLIRAQLAIMMVRAACEPTWDETKCKLERPAVPSFSDVPTTSVYFPYVETAKAKGWMQGDGSGKFHPDAPISRAEAAVALFNHMKSKYKF